ncbi:MAG: Dabb family protein [Bryobacterales bacterium]|nr:Dabb family protein [Bryobacterales bacterium]
MLGTLRWSGAAMLALAGIAGLAAARAYQKPRSVIQVVSVKWAAGAAPELRKAAIEDIEKIAAEVPGVDRLWLRALRVQPRDFMSAFALEFEDQAAADRFARHPAHEAWSKTYLPIIEESRIQQVTN